MHLFIDGFLWDIMKQKQTKYNEIMKVNTENIKFLNNDLIVASKTPFLTIINCFSTKDITRRETKNPTSSLPS
jgi:hypothetical protein